MNKLYTSLALIFLAAALYNAADPNPNRDSFFNQNPQPTRLDNYNLEKINPQESRYNLNEDIRSNNPSLQKTTPGKLENLDIHIDRNKVEPWRTDAEKTDINSTIQKDDIIKNNPSELIKTPNTPLKQPSPLEKTK